MNVFHAPPHSDGFRRVAGPGDLDLLPSGRVRVVGPAGEHEVARWAVALGLFAVRGGSIERHRP